MTIHLVRHAHAGKRSEWQGDDRERPVSERGVAQSAALVEALAGTEVRRIVSSPYLRCVQTVEPLAAEHGLDVELDTCFAEGTDPEAAYGALLALDADDGVACSHGDLIPPLLQRLVADGMDIDGPLLDPKGSMWVIETEHGRPVVGRYVAPGA